jgi:hypothetical protein
MIAKRPITFVVAVRSRGGILETNFLASPCLRTLHDHQILIQENFMSAAKAYNDAIERAVNDLIVFVHQDLILGKTWHLDLARSLAYLEVNDPKWGVLGCSGMTRERQLCAYLYSSGLGVLGSPFEDPVPIQALDEVILILRKSSGLRFDDSLPHFHFYGTDVCLRAATLGMKNYAISAFCIHNTHQNLILAKEFYECYWHIRKVWKNALPIQTTCIRVTLSNLPMYTRKLREAYLRYIRRKEFGGSRAADVHRLLQEVEENAWRLGKLRRTTGRG